MFRLHDLFYLIASQHAANQLMLLMCFSNADVLHSDDDDGTCLCQCRFFPLFLTNMCFCVLRMTLMFFLPINYTDTNCRVRHISFRMTRAIAPENF